MRTLLLTLAVSLTLLPGPPTPVPTYQEWPSGSNPVSGAGYLDPWPPTGGWEYVSSYVELKFYWADSSGNRNYRGDQYNVLAYPSVDFGDDYATYSWQSPSSAQSTINASLAAGYNRVEAHTVFIWAKPGAVQDTDAYSTSGNGVP
jgi:hypothetical protein